MIDWALIWMSSVAVSIFHCIVQSIWITLAIPPRPMMNIWWVVSFRIESFVQIKSPSIWFHQTSFNTVNVSWCQHGVKWFINFRSQWAHWYVNTIHLSYASIFGGTLLTDTFLLPCCVLPLFMCNLLEKMLLWWTRGAWRSNRKVNSLNCFKFNGGSSMNMWFKFSVEIVGGVQRVAAWMHFTILTSAGAFLAFQLERS